jgi:hypothetical protein
MSTICKEYIEYLNNNDTEKIKEAFFNISIFNNIETFADLGSYIKTDDKKINKNLTESTSKITKDMIVKGMASLIKSAATTSMAKNGSEITAMLAAANKMRIGKIKSKKDVKITGISQSATALNKIIGEVSQSVQDKVMNDMSSSLKDVIQKQSEEVKDVAKATSVGDVVGNIMNVLGDVAGKAIDGATKVLDSLADSSMGSYKNKSKLEQSENETRNALQLDDSFKIDKDDSINSAMTNALSKENMAKCAANVSAANEMELSEIESTDGAIEISDIKQTALVDSLTDCVFSQKMLTEVANKAVDSISKTFGNAFKSANKEVAGDIYAAGVAATAVVVAAGQAVSVAAEGAGKGLESAGKGVGNAAEGIGSGISSAAMGMALPLLILAVVAIFALPMIMKMMNPLSALSSGSDGGQQYAPQQYAPQQYAPQQYAPQQQYY